METNGTIICRWRIFHCHVWLPEGMIQAFSLSAIRISWGHIGILQIPNFQTNPYFHECYMMLICLKVGRKTSHLSTCWKKMSKFDGLLCHGAGVLHFQSPADMRYCNMCGHICQPHGNDFLSPYRYFTILWDMAYRITMFWHIPVWSSM